MEKSKVLIVEDEKVTAEILKKSLEKLGYGVTGIASSADSFYKCIQNTLPDIVLMDIFLKGKKDGIELAAETREKYLLPVIFLTAYSDIELLERAKITEPFGYILKPFQSKELHSSIEMALHKHRSEKKIEHLNSILRALRYVNLHINRIDNVPELIQKACETLISTRGYASAWIILVREDGTFMDFASSGLTGGSSHFYTALENGFLPDCTLCLNAGIASHQVRHTTDNCGNCPLKEAYPQNDILTTRIRYKDKHLGYLTVTTQVSLNENKEDIELFTDISEDLGLAIGNLNQMKEKEQAEAALRESEQYARALLNAIPDLIFRMNREGVYLDFKAAKEDPYVMPAAFIGKNHRDLTQPDFADLIEAKIYLTLEHGNMEVFEYQLVIPGKGLRDFEARMVSCGPDEVTAISRDITERKKTEEALKKKVDQLEWFNRMMVDRELKMIELKKEINILLTGMGEEVKYVIHETK